MTDSGDTTMAASEAAGAPFKAVTRKNKSKRLKATVVQENPIERTHSFTIRTYFPPPRANEKFNPATHMRSFLLELLKYEPSLVLVNPNTKAQLVLSTDPIPTKEADFKQIFTISTDSRAANTQRVVVGCHLRSERTINEIKFDKNKPQFIEWLKQQKIFIESDALGVDKTITIGYLTKLHPLLTNRQKVKSLLETALEDIILDPDLAVELDPSLKDERTEAMSNGDLMIPAVPSFEVFKTQISQGKDNTKVTTKVLGIKCAVSQAKLLKEFFSQLGSPVSYEKFIGVFVPTGAANLLGAPTYEKLICKNNLFIDKVTTIPMGDFQHATLDIPFSLDTSTDIDQTTLQELIEDQSWCLSVDKTTTNNKVMITTTTTSLSTAREWLDKKLPVIYAQNIADKIDVTTLVDLMPRRLDKPILTAASTAYANALKQRTSSTTASTDNPKKYTKPPRMPQKTLVDITFDDKEFPALKLMSPQTQQSQSSSTNATITENSSTLSTATPPVKPVYDYKKELERISNEIETTLKSNLRRSSLSWNKNLTNSLNKVPNKRMNKKKSTL